MSFDGSVTTGSDSYGRYNSARPYWINQSLNYLFENPEGHLSINDTDTRWALVLLFAGTGDAFQEVVTNALLEGGFVMQPPVIGSGSIRVLIDKSLSFELSGGLNEPGSEDLFGPEPNAWNFAEGNLQLRAEDDSTLVLEPDNGDENNVRITITNNRGREIFNDPWSQWREYLVVRNPLLE